MSGPYLKMLPVQWVLFSRANFHLFTPKRELRTDLESDRVLRRYRGRVIGNVHAYGLWRVVLDFKPHWKTDADLLAVGRFLTKAKLNPRAFALSEAQGLAQAVKRFALPPLHEWAVDVVRQLDERLSDDYQQEGAHDMVVNALAALNYGPTKVQILMDEWYSKDLVSADEHQFVTDFFASVGFPPPDYVQIRRNSVRSVIVSEEAEVASSARVAKKLEAAREAVGKKTAAKRKTKKKK